MLPASFFSTNRKRLAEKIGEDAIAVVTAADVLYRGDVEYPYRVDPNFYYLTGIEEPEAALILVPGHADQNLRELLFTTAATSLVKAWEGDRLSTEAAAERSGISRVLPMADFEAVLGRLMARYQVVYLDLDESLHSHMPHPAKRLAGKLNRKSPLHQLRSARPILDRLRMVKDPLEIEQIKQAVQVTRSGILAAAKGPIKTENELEARLTSAYITAGARHAFPPIVAAGSNATVIHYMTNNAKIKKDDLVLLDTGAEVGWYAADISRVLPASGRFTKRQREVYEAVLKAQAAGIARHRPGESIYSIDEVMQEVLAEELKKLGVKEAHPREHISHHMGLEVHDTGDPRAELEPGMVVTCEPGLYLRDEGIGVRIEDDILITKDGCVVLSKEIPSGPDDIEALTK